jgi:hypothetical protein
MENLLKHFKIYESMYDIVSSYNENLTNHQQHMLLKTIYLKTKKIKFNLL